MKGSGNLAIVDLHWLFAWGFGLTKQVTPEAAAEPRFGCLETMVGPEPGVLSMSVGMVSIYKGETR